MHTRRLEPGEEDRWSFLLTPEAASLSPGAAFEMWRTQLTALVAMGLVEVQGVFAAGDLAAGALLMRPVGGHRILLGGVGELGGEALPLAVADVMARADAITFTADAGADWAERLAGLGVRLCRQVTYQNPLAVSVALDDAPAPPGAIVPWRDELRPLAVRLGAAANAGRLSGLLLALPEAPSEASLAAVFERTLAPGGPLIGEASFVWEVADRPAGMLLMTRTDAGPLLWELALAPEGRGRGAARALVRAGQRALWALGHTHMRFVTTDDHVGVHRIYQPQEVEVVEVETCAYWLRV